MTTETTIFDKSYSSKSAATRASKAAKLPSSWYYVVQDQWNRWVLENHGPEPVEAYDYSGWDNHCE